MKIHVQEFTSRLKLPVLGQLIEVVFEEMRWAGEAGSLLRIEEGIQTAIETARKQWLEGPKPEQEELFPDTARPKQGEMRFNFTGVIHGSFWAEAEDKILEILSEYANEAQGIKDVGRRLFAEDAVQGFAFIHLCQQRFDAVLMNPPFGSAIDKPGVKCWIDAPANNNLYAAFVLRWHSRLQSNGLLGSITDRTFLLLPTYQK